MSKIRFGDILYIKGRIGWQALSKDEYLQSGEYYLVTGVDITDTHRIDFNNCYYVSKERYEMDDKIQLKVGDIIVTKDGTIGKIGIIDKLDKPATLNSHLFLIRNEAPEVLDTDYLFQILRSKTFQKFALNNTHGSNIPAFTQANISEFEIDLPSLETQRKVSKILKNIDNKIINNIELNGELESLAKTLYDYWFLQFEFLNEEGKPYKSSGGKMVYNEELKREIPEGWEVKPLIECISDDKNALVDGPFGTQMKIGEYVDSGVPIYEMEILNNNFVIDSDIKHFITESKYEEVKRSTVKNGDIIISKTGTLGLLGLVESSFDKGIIVSRLAKITPNEAIIGKYPLFQYLKSLNESGYWLQHCGGSTMPILNNTIIGNVPILLPNIDLYTDYSKKVNYLFKQIHCNQKQNQQLAKLRDFLLPILMNGQVTFKEINQ